MIIYNLLRVFSISFHRSLRDSKSICQNWSFVHIKNSPEYLTRDSVKSVYSFDKIPAVEFDFKKFLVHLKYSFIFSFFHFFDTVHF